MFLLQLAESARHLRHARHACFYFGLLDETRRDETRRDETRRDQTRWDETRRECVTRQGNSFSPLGEDLCSESSTAVYRLITLDRAKDSSLSVFYCLHHKYRVYHSKSLPVFFTSRRRGKIRPWAKSGSSRGVAYQLFRRSCTKRETEITTNEPNVASTTHSLSLALPLPYLTRALYHPSTRPTTVATFTIAINGVSRRVQTTTDKRTASCNGWC